MRTCRHYLAHRELAILVYGHRQPERLHIQRQIHQRAKAPGAHQQPERPPRREHDQRRKTNTRTSIDTDPRGKQRRITLAALGHFTKHNVPPLRYLQEFTVAVPDDFAEGAILRADLFTAGEKVNVAGTSKGRGFAGVMKRYGFKGGKASHGSMFHRKPASGGATDAARVFPGARRPGHMGNEQVTVKGLTVVRADAEKNMLVLKGAVPGANGSLVVVTLPDRPVIERGKDWFAVQASAETLAMTTLGSWRPGTKVNLERALKVGDELGGHIVSGHVDGVAKVVSIRPENDSLRYTFEAPPNLAPFVAPKGSVALDGVSLTVNEVDGARFGVNIIPHTQKVTTFGTYVVGSMVNMEIDMLARYVARLLGKD